jgi:hypothetical protein
MDARRAPERIGEGHGADELRNLRGDVRSTGSTVSGLPVPEGPEALPVPANDGLGANNVKRLSPPCPALRKPNPEEAIEETESRSLGASTEQGEPLS